MKSKWFLCFILFSMVFIPFLGAGDGFLDSDDSDEVSGSSNSIYKDVKLKDVTTVESASDKEVRDMQEGASGPHGGDSREAKRAQTLRVLKTFVANITGQLKAEGERFKDWVTLDSTKKGLRSYKSDRFKFNLYNARLEAMSKRGDEIQKFLNNFMDNVLDPALEAKTEAESLKIATPHIRSYIKERMKPYYNTMFATTMKNSYDRLATLKTKMVDTEWSDALGVIFATEKSSFFDFEVTKDRYLELKSIWESVRDNYTKVENIDDAKKFAKFEDSNAVEIVALKNKCVLAKQYCDDFIQLIDGYKSAYYELKNYHYSPIGNMGEVEDLTPKYEAALAIALTRLESFASNRSITEAGLLNDPNADLEARAKAHRDWLKNMWD